MREGTDLTLVAHSYTVQRALRVADNLSRDGIEVEVVDLRSLRPLDAETVAESVRKTNRALIAEEGWPTYGVSAELAARIHRALLRRSRRAGRAGRRRRGADALLQASGAGCAAAGVEDRGRGAVTAGRDAGSHEGGFVSEELVMPRLSDTMEEGTIGRWLVHEGDSFSEGDVLAEIETDKATMEFQAYDAGTVLRILVADGETAAAGCADRDRWRAGRVGAGDEKRRREAAKAEQAPKPEAEQADEPRAGR